MGMYTPLGRVWVWHALAALAPQV